MYPTTTNPSNFNKKSKVTIGVKINQFNLWVSKYDIEGDPTNLPIAPIRHMVNKMNNKSKIMLSSFLSKVFHFEGKFVTFSLKTSSPSIYRKAKSIRYILWATCIIIIVEFVWTNFCILKQPPMASSYGHPLPFYLYFDGYIMSTFMLPNNKFDTKFTHKN
jgi:hypothetical protein